MAKSCKYIKKTLDMVKKMIILADKAEMGCSEYSATVLFGVVRDCAYKIKGRAEGERDRLKMLGDWEMEQACLDELKKETENETR
jgi:hypothetical protein